MKHITGLRTVPVHSLSHTSVSLLDRQAEPEEARQLYLYNVQTRVLLHS